MSEKVLFKTEAGEEIRDVYFKEEVGLDEGALTKDDHIVVVTNRRVVLIEEKE